MKKFSIIRWVLIPLVTLLVAGCGGSGSSSHVVSGTVAAGAPLVGSVYLKDSSVPAQERSATIAPDGSYRFDLAGLKAPYLLKASGSAHGAGLELYSLAARGGIANITPLSSLAVALADGGADPAILYDATTPEKLLSVTEALPQAVTMVGKALKPTLDRFGAGGADFMSAPLTADHQGLDLFLDLATISVGNGVISLGDVMAQKTLTVQIDEFMTGSFDFIAAPVTTAGTLCVVPGKVSLFPGSLKLFFAFVIGSTEREFAWSVVEEGGGVITSNGLYIAPAEGGSYQVRAASLADPAKSGTALVTVSPPKNVVSLVATAPGVFTVMGSNLQNVGGAEIEISYDTATLAKPVITQGALVTQTTFIATPNFGANKVKFAFMTLQPISGSGPLATITFDLLGTSPGSAVISKKILAFITPLAGK
jgi:hypothetical protein